MQSVFVRALGIFRRRQASLRTGRLLNDNLQVPNRFPDSSAANAIRALPDANSAFAESSQPTQVGFASVAGEFHSLGMAVANLKAQSRLRHLRLPCAHRMKSKSGA
jgi:hypothetical protein